MFCLDRGNPRRVDPTHLARADADRHAVLAIDNRVGLDKLGDPPGEEHVLHLGFGRLAFTDHLQLRSQFDVEVLDQYTAVDLFHVEASRRLRRPFSAFEQANVLLARHHIHRSSGDLRRDDHFDELLVADSLSGLSV